MATFEKCQSAEIIPFQGVKGFDLYINRHEQIYKEGNEKIKEQMKTDFKSFMVFLDIGNDMLNGNKQKAMRKDVCLYHAISEMIFGDDKLLEIWRELFPILKDNVDKILNDDTILLKTAVEHERVIENLYNHAREKYASEKRTASIVIFGR